MSGDLLHRGITVLSEKSAKSTRAQTHDLMRSRQKVGDRSIVDDHR